MGNDLAPYKVHREKERGLAPWLDKHRRRAASWCSRLGFGSSFENRRY